MSTWLRNHVTQVPSAHLCHSPPPPTLFLVLSLCYSYSRPLVSVRTGGQLLPMTVFLCNWSSLGRSRASSPSLESQIRSQDSWVPGAGTHLIQLRDQPFYLPPAPVPRAQAWPT